MKNLKSFIITCASIALLASCSNDNCISGEGNYTSKTYSPNSFHAVSVAGEADVYFTKDSTYSLRIEAQSNVLNELNVEVVGQELTIGEDNCFKDIRRMKIYISTPSLTEVKTAGSINVYSPDTYSASSFTAILSGSGNMEFNLNVQEFDASISGDGDIKANGTAARQYFTSSGDGYFSCFDLVGEDVDIDVSGSASLEVHATKTLNIDVSGSATIYYKGHPSITQNVSGTATIVDAN